MLLINNVNIFKNTSLNQRVLLGNVIIKYTLFIKYVFLRIKHENKNNEKETTMKVDKTYYDITTVLY